MADPLNLAVAAYQRTGFPTIETVNCLSERSEATGEVSDSLIARPGLEEFANVGTAPIRAIFQRKGLFNDAALVIANTGAHLLSADGSQDALGGTIAGEDLVDVDAGLDADGNSVARVATGSALYKIVEGGGAAAEVFPTSDNNVGASSVAYYKGYWLAVEAGTDYVYYQIPAATDWNPIEFAAAEYQPDRLVAVRTCGDLAVLLGEATTEVWYATGDAANALAPYGGLKFDFGCLARNAAVNCQGALIWVDDNCMVRLFEGSQPSIISDNGLSEQIRRATAADIRASFFIFDQHPCYVLTLGEAATWIYDLSTRRWSKASSLGLDYWTAHLFCNIGSTVLGADALNNQVYRLDPDRAWDGGNVFTMTFCGIIPPQPQPAALANVILRCELGGAPLTGQGSDPIVSMQLSRDGSKTYGPAKERSMGAAGQYAIVPRWSALGQTKANLMTVAKFQISDPVRRRVSAILANVP